MKKTVNITPHTKIKTNGYKVEPMRTRTTLSENGGRIVFSTQLAKNGIRKHSYADR